MNKAIAIFNFPDSCNECELCVSEYSFWGDVSKSKCLVLGQDNIGALIKECRMNCCPLKPIPQKKKVREINKVDDFMKTDIQIINEKVSAEIMLDTELLLASGYNRCIDEILGDEE